MPNNLHTPASTKKARNKQRTKQQCNHQAAMRRYPVVQGALVTGAEPAGWKDVLVPFIPLPINNFAS
eukprot:6420850-Amphidinium_carterae.2